MQVNIMGNDRIVKMSGITDELNEEQGENRGPQNDNRNFLLKAILKSLLVGSSFRLRMSPSTRL